MTGESLDDPSTSPDYSQWTAIKGRALRSEGNGPVPWRGLQTEFLECTPGKSASVLLGTNHGIGIFPLCAFAPPGSPLDRHSVVTLPRTMNNPG